MCNGLWLNRCAVAAALTLVSLVTAAHSGATESPEWANAEQQHADQCTTLTKSSAYLRYPDNSFTTFAVNPSLASLTRTCRVGTGNVGLDVHEVLRSSSGYSLYFHRGGHGYSPPGNVRYGHLWWGDLTNPPPAPATWAAGYPYPNGRACTPSTTPGTRGAYWVRPKSIPNDMYYLGVNTSGRSQYVPYGSPATDQGTPNGVRYKYLLWNWINVGYGGQVRALMPDGQLFERCDVLSRTDSSYSSTGTSPNGWVQAIYGRIRFGGTTTYAAGGGSSGYLYGWTVYAHYRNGDSGVTYHVDYCGVTC